MHLIEFLLFDQAIGASVALTEAMAVDNGPLALDAKVVHGQG